MGKFVNENKIVSDNDRKRITLLNNDKFLYEYKKLEYFENIVAAYKIIKSIKYIPQMIFDNNSAILPHCGETLNNLNLDNFIKEEIKKQLIDFIQQLYLKKIAHRDLHTKNVCWDGEQIWVIDWEFITKNTPNKLIEHYDLTGEGLESPLTTNNMNIFKINPYGIAKWLNPIKININDFVMKE